MQAELKEAGAEEAHIITESVGRNTAPAISLVMAYIKMQGAADRETVFISRADHLINPVAEFRKTVTGAEALAKDGKIVTFGIVPDKPETGYGYIKKADKISGNAYAVEAFKEKPDEQTAAEYVKAGCYYWNSDMFM